MPMITLPAHFDGNKICLDETFALLPNMKLIVTVLSELEDNPKLKINNDHENWLNLSEQRLIDAYGVNEPEYSPKLLKEANPNYEGR